MKKIRFKNTWKSKAGWVWLILLIYIIFSFFIDLNLIKKVEIGFGIYILLFMVVNLLFTLEYDKELEWRGEIRKRGYKLKQIPKEDYIDVYGYK